MLDGRILAAVLASVAAIAAGINGGGVADSIDADRVKSSSISAPGEFSFNDFVPDSMNSLNQFFQNPEPENSVKASLVAEDISDERLNIRGASLSADNFTSLKFGNRKAVSDENIVVYGFDGTIEPAEISRVRGTASGFTTSGVNVSGSTRIDRELETRAIRLNGVERTRLNLEETSGVIEANSSSTELKSARRVKINSFSGDIKVFPMNGSVMLDGKVDQLEAGSFSFGG